MLPSEFKDELTRAFSAACEKAEMPPPAGAAILEKPREAQHGDFCCPLALALARQHSAKPRQVAGDIVASLARPDWVEDVQIAGPGFINVTVNKTAKTAVAAEILSRGEEYGRRAPRNETILLEFVSANPTGPLHVGHGRACAYGDSLANIMEARGYAVRREYYVNDSGRQMDILAASLWLRHWKIAPPEGAYQGEYLLPVAAALAEEFSQHQPPPDSLSAELQKAETADDAADMLVAAARAAVCPAEKFAALQKRVCNKMLNQVIMRDMENIGVNVGGIKFFRESSLYENKLVEKALQELQQNGELKEEDGALWFVSSARGDEKDRVIRRSNGELTYFAADIAYHADKLNRDRPPGGYRLINVLGADHHGYVARLKAAVGAVGGDPEILETRIIQLVALYRNGLRAKMSTRAGEFVALQEVVDEVGADAARYFYINRKNDKHLDFDLAVAKARNNNNPVYYLQYANARINGVFRKRGGGRADNFLQTPTALLGADEAAVALCAALIGYPDAVERAAAERAPHLLAACLQDIAAALHGWYEKTRMLDGAEEEVAARLALLAAAQIVMNNGAKLLGVSLPESL